ncbi:MAG: UDP-N-acetyl-alpha-D-glucosamine C6 dehydratase [Ignavibacteriaceae bacterium]|nr:UDP-N-acetyl-alpha-D-glucosamine C6 dehydratase [Ignavibacteriaceae bacterium]
MPVRFLYSFMKDLRSGHFFLIDFLFLLFTPLLAYMLRFDGDIPFSGVELQGLISATLIFTFVKMLVYWLLGLYRRYWETASIDELAQLLFIGMNATIAQLIVFVVLRKIPSFGMENLPYSFSLIDSILSGFFVATARFSIRLVERANQRMNKLDQRKIPTIVIGAGLGGTAIVEEMQRNNNLNMHPVAFLDDDENKLRTRIRGVQVMGRINQLEEVVQVTSASRVIIAIPSAQGKSIRKILKNCEKIGIETLTLPGLEEMLNYNVRLDNIRKVQIEDLLRRTPVVIDTESVNSFMRGKVILVTGGGGSIGSELCRQILKARPSKLIILGHGENSIFEIEQELFFRLGKMNGGQPRPEIISRIVDIRDHNRVQHIFSESTPDIVFHAAAHKHVPLMEHNPAEAISNNVIGTLNLLKSAAKYKTSNFVLISTDKAVNPTSIMGASKRLAEMLVLSYASKTDLNACAVRFGNVLGSRGSVINTFRKQLDYGGPITITHPDIRRFFMTIPEAVLLVLQASELSKGGEIYVLDMGEPVKIVDLARDLIKLSGLREDIDVRIEYTGLRPGEKLYEELFLTEENYERTEHEKIFFAKNSSQIINGELELFVGELHKMALKGDSEHLKTLIKNFIPEYNWEDAPGIS